MCISLPLDQEFLTVPSWQYIPNFGIKVRSEVLKKADLEAESGLLGIGGLSLCFFGNGVLRGAVDSRSPLREWTMRVQLLQADEKGTAGILRWLEGTSSLEALRLRVRHRQLISVKVGCPVPHNHDHHSLGSLVCCCRAPTSFRRRLCNSSSNSLGFHPVCTRMSRTSLQACSHALPCILGWFVFAEYRSASLCLFLLSTRNMHCYATERITSGIEVTRLRREQIVVHFLMANRTA